MYGKAANLIFQIHGFYPLAAVFRRAHIQREPALFHVVDCPFHRARSNSDVAVFSQIAAVHDLNLCSGKAGGIALRRRESEHFFPFAADLQRRRPVVGIDADVCKLIPERNLPRLPAQRRDFVKVVRGNVRTAAQPCAADRVDERRL